MGLGAVINFIREYGRVLSDPASFTPPGRRRRREELEGPLSTERRSRPMGTGLNYSIRDYLRLCNGEKLVKNQLDSPLIIKYLQNKLQNREESVHPRHQKCSWFSGGEGGGDPFLRLAPIKREVLQPEPEPGDLNFYFFRGNLCT